LPPLRIDHGAQRQLLQVHELRLNIGMQLDSGSDDVRASRDGWKGCANHRCWRQTLFRER